MHSIIGSDSIASCRFFLKARLLSSNRRVDECHYVEFYMDHWNHKYSFRAAFSKTLILKPENNRTPKGNFEKFDLREENHRIASGNDEQDCIAVPVIEVINVEGS